jgi:hypothetical protein
MPILSFLFDMVVVVVRLRGGGLGGAGEDEGHVRARVSVIEVLIHCFADYEL